jgi:Cu/Ag efflux protein CusF
MNAELCSIPPGVLPRSVDSSSPALIGSTPDDKLLQECGVEVVVPIGYAQGDKRYVAFGARRGGRRYLSEDLEVLARMAASIGEQIEHIRDVETQQLITQAELRALQAQIHPHFLFNAFNTLYGIIPRQASGARRMVLNLSEIFRYFLQSERTFVSLDEELRIVRAYLAIEELRLQDKLQINIDVASDVSLESVPMLSIQPLVENAIKHSVATRPEGGAIRIRARREGDRLHVQVHDTGPGFAAGLRKSRNNPGVGLKNVSRRLVLCYGPEADLQIESGAEGTTVSFVVPCERPRSPRGHGLLAGDSRLGLSALKFPGGETMKFSVVRFVVICIALLAIPSRVAGEQGAKDIAFFGRVVAVHSSDGTATIKHGKIPGFMDAMTMDYTIVPQSTLEKLSPGDDIRGNCAARGNHAL